MRLVPLLVVLGLLALPAAAEAQTGIIGPAEKTLPSGQRLSPAGGGIGLGQFSYGGALTPDGRYWWSPSTGWGANDVRIVDVARRKVIQTLPLPGASGGIAMDPKRHIAYVSVVGNSMYDGFRKGLRGVGGNNVQAFTIGSNGRARFDGLIKVGPPPGTAPPQTFPPGAIEPSSWADASAVSPDAKHLLVALNLASAAAVIDLPSRKVHFVPTGDSPHGAAVLGDNRHGLIANETPGTVTVIDLDKARAVKTIRVGGHNSHPGAIAVDNKHHRAYVAVTNQDTVAVVDTDRLRLRGAIPIRRLGEPGTSPVALALTPDRTKLLVAEAYGNELAVVDITGRPRIIGRIPTAQYPDGVAVTGGSSPRVIWQAGKSLGIGPNPNGPSPFDPNDPAFLGFNPALTTRQFESNIGYPPGEVVGELGSTPLPDRGKLRRFTAQANAALVPDDPQAPPPDTPLRADGPIKYVFWIVRENRTYDQTLGDLGRGDGDPNLTLFGSQITPNIHAISNRFGLLDHVYANSEASIQGHYITAAAMVPDYVERTWYANYAGRPRPYDYGVFVVSWPATGFLIDAVAAHGVPYFNYGEAISGDIGLIPDKNRTPAEMAQIQERAAHSDLGQPVTPDGCYDNSAFIGKNSITGNENYDDSLPPGAPAGSTSRFDCFRTRFRQQLAQNAVPGFNYVVLPNNHTRGTQAGDRTPTAMIAENDEAVGQYVDEISHSPIWPQTAIFVAEDDSQDGADHVDAHRIDAQVISPYTRPGTIVSRRYDLYSVIRSMELILGVDPLTINDARAVPLYDAFSPTPDNLAPYSAVKPNADQTARNAPTAPYAAVSKRMNSRGTDGWPQRVLDRALWHSVHGAHATAPAPGPNATRETDEGATR